MNADAVLAAALPTVIAGVALYGVTSLIRARGDTGRRIGRLERDADFARGYRAGRRDCERKHPRGRRAGP